MVKGIYLWEEDDMGYGTLTTLPRHKSFIVLFFLLANFWFLQIFSFTSKQKKIFGRSDLKEKVKQ